MVGSGRTCIGDGGLVVFLRTRDMCGSCCASKDPGRKQWWLER